MASRCHAQGDGSTRGAGRLSGADLLLAAAGREALLGRLGDALSRTTRQVNSLEHRVAPELAGTVASMRRTLDEREREEHYRLQRLLRRR